MIVPVDGYVKETQDIAEEDWRKGEESAEIRFMRRLQLQHHDRDDDRDHPVAEALKPALVHSAAFPGWLLSPMIRGSREHDSAVMVSFGEPKLAS